MKTLMLATLLLVSLLAGCATTSHSGDDAATTTYASLGYDGTHWPDLHGEKVVLLDHGAFDAMFGPTKQKFEALTNGTLEHISGQDTGDALNRAIHEKDAPSFDVIYGLDNAYLSQAVRNGALQAYKPLLAGRILPIAQFFDPNTTWWATPADHGYIAVNVDARANLTVNNLFDVRSHAADFVTQDPRTSSPGLGFLLATIATFGEKTPYDWQDYWNDLFAGGVTITPDWTTAYASDFTGGYGQFEDGFAGSKTLVTSYTTSPAYEMFYGYGEQNGLVLAPLSTFHQVETAAIAKNAKHLAAAQAFIEFVLTDGFQDLHAEDNAVYPVVAGINVTQVYNGTDPAPGTFLDAGLTYQELGNNLERWVGEWVALYEAHQAQ